jgi:molecular chaperone DnaK
VFSTAADNQDAVDIQVHQGERKVASANRLLGTFRLDGIPVAPRGMPQIEVTFDIDANGILNVTAKDKATSRSQNITIQGSSGLDQSDIDRMVADAEAHASEDEVRQTLIEARNNLDSLIYQTEKVLGEHTDKLPADEVSQVEASVASAKESLDSDDIEALKAASEELTAANHKLAEVIYKANESTDGESTNGATTNGDGFHPPPDAGSEGDDVIDAEFEEA